MTDRLQRELLATVLEARIQNEVSCACFEARMRKAAGQSSVRRAPIGGQLFQKYVRVARMRKGHSYR